MNELYKQSSFCNTIIMLLEAGRKVIVTEGDVDFDILYPHIHDDVKLVRGTGGREHVLKVAEDIRGQGYIDALFLVDRDFDGVLKFSREFGESVLPSRCHDFIMDLLEGCPKLLGTILDQVLARERRSPESKIRADLTSRMLVEDAIDYAFKMSAVRIHSLNNILKWEFTRPILTTFDGAIGTIYQIVERVLQKNHCDSSSVRIDSIVEDVENVWKSLNDEKISLVGDHDFFDALAVVCRREGICVSADALSGQVAGAVRCDVMLNVFWFSEIEKWCHSRDCKGLDCRENLRT
jgi:hypothetical protein